MKNYDHNPSTVVTLADTQGKFIMAVNRLIKSVYEHDSLETFRAAEEVYNSEAYKKQNSDVCLDAVIIAADSNDADELNRAVVLFLDNMSLLDTYTTEYELAGSQYSDLPWRDQLWEQKVSYNGKVIYINSSDLKQKYFPVSGDFIRRANSDLLPF